MTRRRSAYAKLCIRVASSKHRAKEANHGQASNGQVPQMWIPDVDIGQPSRPHGSPDFSVHRSGWLESLPDHETCLSKSAVRRPRHALTRSMVGRDDNGAVAIVSHLVPGESQRGTDAPSYQPVMRARSHGCECIRFRLSDFLCQSLQVLDANSSRHADVRWPLLVLGRFHQGSRISFPANIAKLPPDVAGQAALMWDRERHCNGS